MRGILKSPNIACESEDWRLQAKVDVILQYSKANAFKNSKIQCASNPSEFRHRSVRLVRFSDEKPLPTELAYFLKSSRMNDVDSVSRSDTSGPKLASRLFKTKLTEEALGTFKSESDMRASGSSDMNHDHLFHVPAAKFLSQWKDVMSSNDIFASLTSSWLNTADHQRS